MGKLTNLQEVKGDLSYDRKFVVTSL